MVAQAILSPANWINEFSKPRPRRAAWIGRRNLGRGGGAVSSRRLQTPPAGSHFAILVGRRRAHRTEASPPNPATLEPAAATDQPGAAADRNRRATTWNLRRHGARSRDRARYVGLDGVTFKYGRGSRHSHGSGQGQCAYLPAERPAPRPRDAGARRRAGHD